MSAPKKRSIVVAGARTAYWEYGTSRSDSSRTLIMIHGFRGDHHGLEGIARRLRAGRVIVPDVPSFGESDALHEHTLTAYACWLKDFCLAVAPDGFSLLGHSFGSLIVSSAIADGLTPEQLVLINPISSPALHGPRALLTRGAIAYYELGDRLPEPIAHLLLRSPVIVRAMSVTMAKTRDRALRRWIHHQHDRYFSTFANRRSLLDSFRASVSHTVVEFSHAFTMPTLLIVGDRDDITPLVAQVKLARSVDTSTLRIVPDVGHLIHYEAVPGAVEHIEEFLTAQPEHESATEPCA